MKLHAGDPPIRPRRRSLRQRMILTFVGLAVVPFVVAMGALFAVARHDVRQLNGTALTAEARLLVEQVQSQVAWAGRSVAGLASLPGVRGYLAGTAPYPQGLFSEARRILPGLRELSLTPGSPDGAASPGAVSWGAGEALAFRVGVTDLAGSPAGELAVSFDLTRIHRLLETYHRGATGGAVLAAVDGTRLAGSQEVPLPPYTAGGEDWLVFEADGVSYFAGRSRLDPVDSGIARDCYVAVVQPAREVFAPFYFVARQVVYLMGALAVVVIALSWRMAAQFLQPILRIRDGAEIVSRIHMGHRIEVDTGDELEELAQEFNRMAESLGIAYEEMEARVQETTCSLQEERNRLATTLRTMAEGVVVANDAGEVLLMNPRARVALGSTASTGIGMPLASVLPGERIEFHLRRLRRAADQGREAVEQVVFPLASGRLLRGSISAVPGPGGGQGGFLVVFRDVSSAADEEQALEEVVGELPGLLKGPVATARSLVQVLERHGDMEPDKRGNFLRAVGEELDRLGTRLEAGEQAGLKVGRARWPACASDPRQLVEEAVGAVPGMYVQVEAPQGAMPPVQVEPFSWVAALTAVLRWVGEKSSGWAPVRVGLELEGDTVMTTFHLDGQPERDPEELAGLAVAPAGEVPLPLEEVVRRNRGELWTRCVVGGGFEVCVGLLRGVSSPAALRAAGIVDEQPEFYDFDLFLPRPAREARELLATPLLELDCVVFDSETTGLQPSQGDELVSLSAVRVRRGKVQSAGTFHTLIHPGRPIPPESTKFHGIVDAMVSEAPRVEEILDQFYQYVGDAVLVAHNAAFDKKFLDLAAGRAGMPLLENPILDTLFLSYGIHKDFQGHNLDAIADRVGVRIEGRHTSMGDARSTAEIFVKLLPLLASRGVRTLGDAKAFCDRMLLLRWQSSRF